MQSCMSGRTEYLGLRMQSLSFLHSVQTSTARRSLIPKLLSAGWWSSYRSPNEHERACWPLQTDGTAVFVGPSWGSHNSCEELGPGI